MPTTSIEFTFVDTAEQEAFWTDIALSYGRTVGSGPTDGFATAADAETFHAAQIKETQKGRVIAVRAAAVSQSAKTTEEIAQTAALSGV